MTMRPDVHDAVAKEGRLYLLALACATPGAIAVYLFHSLLIGIGVFLIFLTVLGSALYAYEKKRAAQQAAPQQKNQQQNKPKRK